MKIIQRGGVDVKRLDETRLDKSRTWKVLVLLLAIAFGLRLFFILQPEVIHNDGIEYIRHAKQLQLGNWSAGKSAPLYPFLIAIVQFVTRNYELAGIWVSVVFGTLLFLPVFYLGKTLFNEKVGFISALFATVHPFLYHSSGSVLTESTYYFLLSTSVLFGWNAFITGRLAGIVLFGLLTSLAYLTRPEGVGLLIVFSIWVLWVHPLKGKREWIRKVGIVSVAVFSFLVFSSPYLIQIRKETGKWQISPKASISIGSLSNEEDVPDIGTIKKKGLILSSLIKDPLAVLGKVGVGLFISLYKFQQAYHPVLFLLAILGFIFLIKSHYSSKGSFYLISYLIFFFGLVLPFYYVTRRYTSQMLSISIPWAAFGCLVVMGWIDKRFAEKQKNIPISAIVVLLFLIVLFVQGRVTHGREFRFIQREVGLWIKGNLPNKGKVMSSMPQEAFYAELPWVRMPQGSYEEIIETARSNGVQYLVTDEKIEEDSPGFLEKIRQGNLIPLLDLRRKNRRMMVFQIGYPRGK